jgi:hypothetical protein
MAALIAGEVVDGWPSPTLPTGKPGREDGRSAARAVQPPAQQHLAGSSRPGSLSQAAASVGRPATNRRSAVCLRNRDSRAEVKPAP